MKRKKLKIFTLIFAVIFISLWAFWEFSLESPVLVHRARRLNMQKLYHGFKAYKNEYKKLPNSLKEVVEAGFLPERSEMYFSPLEHDTFRCEEISYKDCEYEFEFKPDQIIIRIPENVLEKYRVDSISESAKTAIVYK